VPQFDQDTRDRIDALRQLRIDGEVIEGPYELVKIEWPSPDGTKYYSAIAVDEIASVAPPVTVEDPRLIPENTPNWFLPVEIDSSIGDEEVDLTFWDADDVISELVNTHGEGLRVTLLFWFPQVELLLTIWEGHLRNEEEGEIDIVKLKAVQGFRASEADVPSRAHTAYCQAIFGGVLTTQAEIDEQGCNYNLHLPGGTVGIVNPSTGLPWTFCDRRTTSSCVVRGINPLRHLSHHTIINTIVNAQSSGARLLSTSQGNETNLTEPVRVVMGIRRVWDMKEMAHRKDRNTNDPEHGWYQAFYEACEGPIESITQARIQVGDVVQIAVPIHYGARLGNFADVSADNSLTTHSFSATAYIRYAFGWVDPDTIEPEDVKANAVISGLRNIRVYGSVIEDENGILATYFNDYQFISEYGTNTIVSINWTSGRFAPFAPPFPGMPVTPQTGFAIRMEFKISFPYSETFTMRGEFDNAMKLVIDGGTIFDGSFPMGPTTASGTFAATADVKYDAYVEFKQLQATAANPWYCILRWESASQALEIVPPARFFFPATDTSAVGQPTRNRVWQIGRMMTDKRWGQGYDYAKFNIPSWIEAAGWVDDQVRFTDSFGNTWDHERGMSDVELIARKAQTQIEDMCLAGRLSRPFMFDGELHIVPLRALTEDELDDCPEFTDEGEDRNIIWEGEEGNEKTTLTRSVKSSFELSNRIECTYDSAVDDYRKTPLQPVEDIDAQLRAGRVIGDKSLKKNTKQYHLLGVTGEAHAMKLAWSLLDLGPHDEGGLANNLRLKFKIWFLDALDLHMAKVIKVTSSKLTKYGFTYFRILKMEKADNLHYEITAQAYNETYMATFETLLSDIVGSPEAEVPTPPSPDPPQCILDFGDITYTDGVLDIAVPECEVVSEFALTDLGVALTDGGVELTDGA
jgi:hypothetical protein